MIRDFYFYVAFGQTLIIGDYEPISVGLVSGPLAGERGFTGGGSIQELRDGVEPKSLARNLDDYLISLFNDHLDVPELHQWASEGLFAVRLDQKLKKSIQTSFFIKSQVNVPAPLTDPISWILEKVAMTKK